MGRVIIHTDGSCLKNPGPGGWAAILKYNEVEKVAIGGSPATTNNRMELLAVIEGLSLLKKKCCVIVVSDSSYVVDSIEKGWLENWIRKGRFLPTTKKPVTNADLWLRLMPLLEKHSVDMQWIRGHSGHKENERCDVLAKAEAYAQQRSAACVDNVF